MPKIGSFIAGMVALTLGVAPAFASPAGVWDLESKDTRFELALCGDGSQLCGKLVWLSDVDYNEQYKPYLGKLMANGLRQVKPRVWKGQMSLFGYSMSGTITERSADHLTLNGCAFLVVCKTYEMYRHKD